MAPELLSIDTLAKSEAPFISIDGVKFEMVDREEWGLLQSAAFADLQRRFKDIHDRPGVDAVKLRDLAAVIDDMVQAVLPGIKADVLNKLKDKHKLSVITAFNVGAARPSPKTEAPGPQEQEKAAVTAAP